MHSNHTVSLPVEQEQTVDSFAVYDERTGDLLHLHQLVLLQGATPVDLEQEKAAARAFAAEANPTAVTAGILHLPATGKTIDLARGYRVDLRSLTLVELPEDQLIPQQSGRRMLKLLVVAAAAIVGGIVGAAVTLLALR